MLILDEIVQCESSEKKIVGVSIFTGFTIRFDYSYHVNDLIQFDITMHQVLHPQYSSTAHGK